MTASTKLLFAVLFIMVGGVLGFLYCGVSQAEASQGTTIKEYQLGTSHGTLCFEYILVDGHQYLLYHDCDRGGITHSPKCDCFVKEH